MVRTVLIARSEYNCGAPCPWVGFAYHFCIACPLIHTSSDPRCTNDSLYACQFLIRYCFFDALCFMYTVYQMGVVQQCRSELEILMTYGPVGIVLPEMFLPTVHENTPVFGIFFARATEKFGANDNRHGSPSLQGIIQWRRSISTYATWESMASAAVGPETHWTD